MSRILEEIIIENGYCVADIYLEFLNKRFKLAEKKSNDSFKNIEVNFFNDIYDFCLNNPLSGYTIYNLLSKVKEAITAGNYNRLHSFMPDFDALEEKARSDIDELSKQ